jgi:hypothetical protein
VRDLTKVDGLHPDLVCDPAKVVRDLTRGANDLTRGANDLTRGANDLTRRADDLRKGVGNLEKGVDDLTSLGLDVARGVREVVRRSRTPSLDGVRPLS